MSRSRTAEAMRIWLRAHEPPPGRVVHILKLMGYGVFAFFTLLFCGATATGFVGVLAPETIGAPGRLAAAALSVMGLLGTWYSLWRLRAHVRCHGAMHGHARKNA